ncbi:hypothetical protein [Acinetobacter baumannii]|uniref:hypothetical protein n=1 Tax=Acinetobacter baumannii TaxID=470 RepID=UPI000B2C8354|nr:hypothetical protein [Acinetobacter baumannii]MCW1509386.1 hypothetical protein [Acinetobacter baumannii]UMO41696.1 hypothetical protein L2Z44_10700 [Acinetobacter baumannii]WFQ20180.1 hypothetical protein P9J63_11005 [Acinetobacter baumannii]WFQ23803.1 hypothetical protein P9J61_10990 [Acinetobacter baumannii]WFQ27440.1 hypothetical protein P9J59_11000 [Acinetobacter baumannii]
MKEKNHIKQQVNSIQSVVFQNKSSSLDKMFKREEIKTYAADLAKQNVAKQFLQT